MFVLLSVLLLQVVDAAGPGGELGSPVTEESQPFEGDDLVEEPAPPPGRDWGEDAAPADAALAPPAPRPSGAPTPARAADAGLAPARVPASSPAPAPMDDPADHTGVLIAIVLLATALGLAAIGMLVRARRR